MSSYLIQHQPPAPDSHMSAPQSVGAVIVHGFTSDQRAIEPLRQIAHRMGFVTETPLLRGHGGHYRDLRGTRWQHWVDDITEARSRLECRVDQVVLMGFSMGGLLTLASAAQQPENIAAIVALAPAIRIAHPLAPIAWMARGWMPYVPMGKGVAYSNPKLAVRDDSYHRLAVDAFCSFYYATRRSRDSAALLADRPRSRQVGRQAAGLVRALGPRAPRRLRLV
jgi:alpha-beta hydrolase superfamily lysophospholipase